MTHPTDAAIAQAKALLDFAQRIEQAEPWLHKGARFRQWAKEIAADMRDRARELDAEKGGWCRTCGRPAADPLAMFCSDGIHNPNKPTPPAQAAEAAERLTGILPDPSAVQFKLQLDQVGAKLLRNDLLLAIAAMQAGDE